MSYSENIKDSFKILGLNEQALIKVSKDEKATGYGLLTLIIAGIAMAISQLNPFGLVIYPIFLIIGTFIGYSIYHFLAKFILGGKATGSEYFRSLSNSFVLNWLTFIPIVGVFLQFITNIWLTVVHVFILHKVHKLSMLKSIILVLLPMIIAIFVIIFAVSYFGFAFFNQF
ncbi:MAG: hypothetical protein ACOC1K_05930 [Nanoarchaeota archaeon]